MTLKTPINEKVDAIIYGEARFKDDASREDLYLISERLQYHWIDFADLEIHHTYYTSKKQSDDFSEEFKYTHRLELEANPFWTILDDIKIRNRNRLEFKWVEDNGYSDECYRQRWLIEFPLKGIRHINAYYVCNEFFYDFGVNDINENRFVPAGIKFKISKEAGVSLFYMLQAKKDRDWSSNQILGTHLTWRF